MLSAVADVLFYGLASAASALLTSATFIAIRSQRPRTNAIAFLTGLVVGTLIACGLGIALGQAAVDRIDSHATLTAVVTLLFGLALIVVGLRSRASPPQSEPEAHGSRARVILAGLSNVGPAATFSMAALLGFGGPKRLLLTFLAMAAATQVGLRDIVDVTLVVLYVVVSTVIASVSVGIVLFAGARAEAFFARGEAWLSAHSTTLRVWLALGVGAALVADALLHLFV